MQLKRACETEVNRATKYICNSGEVGNPRGQVQLKCEFATEDDCATQGANATEVGICN